MITTTKNLLEDIVCFKYEAYITKEDYETVDFLLFKIAIEKNKDFIVVRKILKILIIV